MLVISLIYTKLLLFFYFMLLNLPNVFNIYQEEARIKCTNIQMYSNSSFSAMPLWAEQKAQIRAYLFCGPSPTRYSSSLSTVLRSRGGMGRASWGDCGVPETWHKRDYITQSLQYAEKHKNILKLKRISKTAKTFLEPEVNKWQTNCDSGKLNSSI